ncbi:hypothetical protein ACF1BQ_032045 [Bradyrhizobium sp. RDT10]
MTRQLSIDPPAISLAKIAQSTGSPHLSWESGRAVANEKPLDHRTNELGGIRHRLAVQESDRSRSRAIWPRAWFLLFAQDLLKIQRGALFSWQAVKVLHSPFDGRQIAGTGNAPSKSHSASPRSMKSGISDACLACCRQSPRQRFAYGQRLISRNGLGGHTFEAAHKFLADIVFAPLALHAIGRLWLSM